MQIWPAIDIRGGKCVRLRQGDYQQETIYDDDPASVARRFVEEGARQLHLVDLDGARDGRLVNTETIAAVVEAATVPCELGGGIRNEEAIPKLFDLGLSRLVIGTLALKQPDWFREMCGRFPGRLVLGIDARDGKVATEGWRETSETAAIELAGMFAGVPLAAIVYTDIAVDGMLTGPNVPAMAEMAAAVEIPVIASGGVSRVEDIKALAQTRVAGCIIGKAIYEKTITIPDALAAAADRA